MCVSVSVSASVAASVPALQQYPPLALLLLITHAARIVGALRRIHNNLQYFPKNVH